MPVAAIGHGGQDFLEAGRLQKTLLDVIGNKRVELAIGTVRPLQPVSHCRALVEQV
jgi:hypothetical protein